MLAYRFRRGLCPVGTGNDNWNLEFYDLKMIENEENDMMW